MERVVVFTFLIYTLTGLIGMGVAFVIYSTTALVCRLRRNQ